MSIVTWRFQPVDEVYYFILKAESIFNKTERLILYFIKLDIFYITFDEWIYFVIFVTYSKMHNLKLINKPHHLFNDSRPEGRSDQNRGYACHT